MEYKRFGDAYVIKMNRGEEVMEKLLEFCNLENVLLASVSAIGACDHVTYGIYDVDERKYMEYELQGTLEITSLLGNVTVKDGEPYLHLHIAVADAKTHVFGGHLKKCVISGTCEMFVNVFPGSVGRKIDPATALNVFEFAGK